MVGTMSIKCKHSTLEVLEIQYVFDELDAEGPLLGENEASISK